MANPIVHFEIMGTEDQILDIDAQARITHHAVHGFRHSRLGGHGLGRCRQMSHSAGYRVPV